LISSLSPVYRGVMLLRHVSSLTRQPSPPSLMFHFLKSSWRSLLLTLEIFSLKLLGNRKKPTLIFTVIVFTISCKTKTIAANVNKCTVTTCGSQRHCVTCRVLLSQRVYSVCEGIIRCCLCTTDCACSVRYAHLACFVFCCKKWHFQAVTSACWYWEHVIWLLRCVDRSVMQSVCSSVLERSNLTCLYTTLLH